MLLPAMLLLALLASTPAAAVAALNAPPPCALPSCGKNHTAVARNTSAPCAPALCGGINITYPFWLAGTHPPECGYRAFEVTCDNGNVTLTKSFLMSYQILDIFYPNNSFRVINVVDLISPNDTCDLDTLFNVSSVLGLSPFKISPKNLELSFLYDCDLGKGHAPPSWTRVPCPTTPDYNATVFALFGNNYTSGDIGMPPPPMNCNVSKIPVLGYQGATGADYQRLLKRGFLLEYMDGGACAACTETGGQCRFNTTDDAIACYCADGDDGWFICGDFDAGEYVYAYEYNSFCFLLLPSSCVASIFDSNQHRKSGMVVY